MFLAHRYFIFFGLAATAVISGLVLFTVVFFEIWYHHLVTTAKKLGYDMEFSVKGKMTRKNKKNLQ